MGATRPEPAPLPFLFPSIKFVQDLDLKALKIATNEKQSMWKKFFDEDKHFHGAFLFPFMRPTKVHSPLFKENKILDIRIIKQTWP